MNIANITAEMPKVWKHLHWIGRIFCAVAILLGLVAVNPHPASAQPQTPSAPDTFDCGAVTSIPADECDALVALYQQTGGSQWTNKTRWLSDPDPCTWNGVTCDDPQSEPTFVKSLDLHENNLIGTLPDGTNDTPSIGDFPNLTTLDLHQNLLYQSIPDAIGDLTNLTTLDLSTNFFGKVAPTYGADLCDGTTCTTQLLDDFWGLVHLSVLNLSENYLTNSDNGLDFSGLTHLTKIDLHNNRLDKIQDNSLTNLTLLDTYNIRVNYFTGNLPQSIMSLPALAIVNLSYNQFSGPIPAGYWSLPAATELHLNDNQLSGSLPDPFPTNNVLTQLDLGYNRLSGPIPATITNLKVINNLALSHNAFGGPIPATMTAAQMPHMEDEDAQLQIDCNGLYASPATDIDFVTGLQSNWQATQTAPPTDILALNLPNGNIFLTWTPIAYTSAAGYYEIVYNDGGGDVTITKIYDKAVSHYLVTTPDASTTHHFKIRTFTQKDNYPGNPFDPYQQNDILGDFSAPVDNTNIPQPTIGDLNPSSIDVGHPSNFQIDFEGTGFFYMNDDFMTLVYWVDGGGVWHGIPVGDTQIVNSKVISVQIPQAYVASLDHPTIKACNPTATLPADSKTNCSNAAAFTITGNPPPASNPKVYLPYVRR